MTSNIKTLLKCQLVFFYIMILFISCNKTVQKKIKVKYEDPEKYYNTLNKSQNNVTNLILEIKNTETSDESRELITKLKKNIANSLNTYYGIMLNKDDYGLKNAFLNQMKFYEKQGLKYIIQIIDIRQEIEILENNDLEVLKSLKKEYKEINEVLSLKEKERSEDIEKIKRNYFKKYNISNESSK